MITPDSSTGTGQQTKNLLLGSIFSALLFSSSMSVPFVGFVAGFVAASPLTHVRINSDVRQATLSMLIAAIIVAAAFTGPVALWYIAQCGLSGLIVSELLVRDYKADRILFWGTLSSTFASACFVIFLSMVMGQGINAIASKEIMTGINQVISIYEQQKSISTEEMELIRQGIKKAGNLMLRIYPALAVINMFIFSSVTLLLGKWLLSRKTGLEIHKSCFSEFKTPELLIWPLIVSGFSLLLPDKLLNTIALNLLALLLPLYFLQGLAVIFSLCNRNQYKNILKVISSVLLITQPYLIVVVTVAGLFELLGEFRTPRLKREENL